MIASLVEKHCLFQVVQGSLVIPQHFFDLTSSLQSDHIFELKNIQVIQGSFVIHQFNFNPTLSSQSGYVIIGWKKHKFCSSHSSLHGYSSIVSLLHITFAKWLHHWVWKHQLHSRLLNFLGNAPTFFWPHLALIAKWLHHCVEKH